jgi:hypothetical protein
MKHNYTRSHLPTEAQLLPARDFAEHSNHSEELLQQYRTQYNTTVQPVTTASCFFFTTQSTKMWHNEEWSL